jgi:hypothetical protein
MFEYFSISEDALHDKKLSSSIAMSSIVRFINREEFATRCDYGRYHCLTSQLPRKAREYLTIVGGEPLCVVDVSACQPLILGVLAGKNYNQNYCQQRQPQQRQQQLDQRQSPYAARFCRSEFPEDVNRWIGLCESADKNNRLYSFLQNKVMATDGPVQVTIHRKDGRTVRRDLKDIKPKEFKRCVLIPLFDDTAKTKANAIFKLIIEPEFATIAEFIIQTKSDGHYQRTACWCQMTESRVMIDGVGERLLRDFPNEPVQPIHDAIICRAAFAETVRQIIRDCFLSLLGVLPNVEIDPIANS